VQQTRTHWSRIFYHDLFSQQKETHVYPKRTQSFELIDETRPPSRSPLASAMLLLGIYIAMYLAVAEVVHVLAPAQAATAVVRDDAPMSASASASAPIMMPAPAGGQGPDHAYTD
jgi:hypothetical protein